MATRQDIQIALDLIKHVNTPNDLLLSAAVPVAKGKIRVTEGAIGEQVERDMTVDEQKANLARLAAQAKGYRDKCASFLAVPAQRTSAAAGLAALGVDMADIEADIATIQTASDQMATGAANARKAQDLVAVGRALLEATPELPLVRKG